MRIEGQWVRFADNEERPIVTGHVVAADGTRVPTVFLVDTGADRSVLNHRIHAVLGHLAMPATENIAGVGGLVQTVSLEGAIWLRQHDGTIAVFRGNFGMVNEPTALDLPVLGRDILRWFSVIVDQPGRAILLLNQNHRYAIVGG